MVFKVDTETKRTWDGVLQQTENFHTEMAERSVAGCWMGKI